MHINLILVPLIIVLGLLLGAHDTLRHRRVYIVFCIAILAFVAAMRSPEYMTGTYGIDTLNYKHMFEQTLDLGWSDLWESVLERYVYGTSESDIGFVGLQKLISLVTDDFYVYSLLADLLFFVPFGIILYRYATSMKQLIFAFVFYVSLVQVFFLGGARQIFAIGFDLMALLAVLDKRKILTVVLFIVGVSFHFSSILFAIPLLMIWFDASPKLLKLMHILCFVLFPIILLMPNQIIVFMGGLVGMEKYSAYGEGAIQGGATTFIVLIELLSLFCLIAIKKRNLIENASIRNFYVMVPLFTILAPLIQSNGSMIRIALYYYLFLVLLVPYALDCMFTKRDRAWAYVITIGALSYLTLSGGGTKYYFFWQY